MKKEDVSLLAQLLASMKDAVNKLESAYRINDMEKLSAAKTEIMLFQKRVDELL